MASNGRPVSAESAPSGTDRPRIAEYWGRVVKVSALRAGLAGHQQSERQRNNQ
jgi:hypothetical protein